MFNTSLNNATDRIQAAAASMPSNRYEDLTLGASGAEYIAPANGWVNFNKLSTVNGQTITLSNMGKDNTTLIENAQTSVDGVYLHASIPVKKGDVFIAWYNAGGATTFFRFVYAEGDLANV